MNKIFCNFPKIAVPQFDKYQANNSIQTKKKILKNVQFMTITEP